MSAANLSAADALARLRERTLSSEELVRACLARIEERDAEVKAWAAIDREDALAQARRIDSLQERPPLCGLPIGIKDLIDTQDLPTTYGSPIYRGHRPERDAACVRALREAGAVILGKTVTTEFAVFSPGPTRNPRDLSRTPGGSSSGSAAAVADFMVPAALGSQTAASVIRPGSFCGVVAMKPTFGRLPLEGVHPLSPSLDTLGAFTRQVADLPPILTALGLDLPEEIPPLEKPRLGLCRTELWDLAERSTRAAVEQAAAALERQGAQVREIDLGRSFLGLADAQSTYSVLPEGKTYDDKFVFGVYRGATMVGCADLIRDYPDRGTALLGLLLIAEPYQGQGIGRVAYQQLEAFIRSWNTCSRVRIGVVRTNERVLPFWSKLGFVPSGETKPYRYDHVVSETIILTKSLD